jgi:L-alanine-DL-glutamate epimerase-like enolase superfamily enzyme
MAGGLTPVLEIATVTETFDVSMSPYFLPGLFVHLASVSPAVTWLEEFPLLEPLFEGWPELGSNGLLEPYEVPGAWLDRGLGCPEEVSPSLMSYYCRLA